MLNAVRTAIATVIEKRPTAAFTPSSTSGIAPFKVTLTNTTTGATSFMWDFGDSTFSNARSPLHTYLSAGTYTVTLTAAGPAGTGSTSATAQITVNAALAASAAQSTVTTTSTTTLTTAAASVTTVAGGCSAGTLLGDTTLGTDDQSAAGVATAFSTKATFCGTLASLSVFLERTSTATKLNVGLYSDANGHPGTLLAQGSTSSPSPGAWNTVSISPTAVTAGGAYWIAILGTQAGTVHFDTKAGSSCSREMSAQSNLTALPNTWTTGSFDPQAACQVSAYGSSAQ